MLIFSRSWRTALISSLLDIVVMKCAFSIARREYRGANSDRHARKDAGLGGENEGDRCVENNLYGVRRSRRYDLTTGPSWSKYTLKEVRSSFCILLGLYSVIIPFVWCLVYISSAVLADVGMGVCGYWKGGWQKCSIRGDNRFAFMWSVTRIAFKMIIRVIRWKAHPPPPQEDWWFLRIETSLRLVGGLPNCVEVITEHLITRLPWNQRIG